MKAILRWLVLRALRDDRVREEIAAIIRTTQPLPRHRSISTNKAPGTL